MLKIRLMGTVEEIEWFTELIQNHANLNFLDHSEILELQCSIRYFRRYCKVQQKIKNIGKKGKKNV